MQFSAQTNDGQGLVVQWPMVRMRNLGSAKLCEQGQQF